MKRVEVSKVRMPRSQRMTFGLPPLSTYSADSSHSWIDVDMPRLSSTGLPTAPTLRSSEKFCTLRAPICKISACSATTSTLSGSITSVMIGSPVSRRASARSLSPSSSRPWNAYGDVRGLNAPPRSTAAPAAFTRVATSSTCSRDSTEHGPAMTTIFRPPMPTLPTCTTLLALRTSRLASLNGCRIGVTDSTVSSDSSERSRSLPRSSPMAPMTVRSSPRIVWGR